MIEHENTRLIGVLIGEMKGVNSSLERLNNTLEASITSTHDRFDYEKKQVVARFEKNEAEIADIKTMKGIVLAHIKGGMFTAAFIILILTTGLYTAIKTVVGVFSGIKLG
jgi:hypothetical protein